MNQKQGAEAPEGVLEVLKAYVLGYVADNGRPPTIAEVADHWNSRGGSKLSPFATRYWLDHLVLLGKLKKVNKGRWAKRSYAPLSFKG